MNRSDWKSNKSSRSRSSRRSRKSKKSDTSKSGEKWKSHEKVGNPKKYIRQKTKTQKDGKSISVRNWNSLY